LQEILPPLYNTPPGKLRKLRSEVDENISNSRLIRKMLGLSATHVNILVTIAEVVEIHLEMRQKRQHK